MLTKLAGKLERDGLSKTLTVLRKKLLSIQRHEVYIASCTDAEEPDWLPGERVCFSSDNDLWNQLVFEQLVSLSADNRDYLEAVARGEAEGLAVLCDGKPVHYAFLMHRNKMTSLLGFGKRVGLLGNAFTIDGYRGRGCHARSVRARIRMAGQLGLRQVISETAHDNTASRHGLAKGGMKYFGTVAFVVLLNVLVVRYTRPHSSIKRVELCW